MSANPRPVSIRDLPFIWRRHPRKISRQMVSLVTVLDSVLAALSIQRMAAGSARQRADDYFENEQELHFAFGEGWDYNADDAAPEVMGQPVEEGGVPWLVVHFVDGLDQASAEERCPQAINDHTGKPSVFLFRHEIGQLLEPHLARGFRIHFAKLRK